MDLKTELKNRGFLYQYTDEKLFEIFDKGGENLYFGCDPTADSLHLGNFCVFMQAINFMKRKNKLYMLVGGATGMIGDPGGKDTERQFIDEETLSKNISSITKQVSNILKHLKKLSGINFEFEVVNNADFYKEMSYLKFLRDVGKHITVNSMISKETIKKRIEDSEKSISYTEFSYMLLQGYDFLYLNQNYNVNLQIAGSDQRGNIVTGTELIRKKLDKQVYGATGPLILDSTGKKFGKSEGNAIWLDSKKNSPFFVYQYFINTADEDLERYLKLFTLLDFEQIQKIVDKHQKKPELRHGQEQLANYIIQTIFGEKASKQAEKITKILFSNQNKLELLKSMDKEELESLYNETGGTNLNGTSKILDLLTKSGISKSNGEAKQLIQSGSIYFNEQKIEDIQKTISQNDLINGVGLFRKGKKVFKTIKSQ